MWAFFAVDKPWRCAISTLVIPVAESISHDRPIRRHLQPNSFMGPGSALAEISGRLESQLNGEGGSIEQTALYIDPSSGRLWYAVTNQADYIATNSGRPIGDLANHIKTFHLGPDQIEHMDIFALGSGDGKTETLLTQHLLKHVLSLDLLLWDISQPLLDIAYSHALAVLGERYKSNILTVPANFFQIASAPYVDLYRPQLPGTRRLITLFGYTFGNLESEILFIRNHLGGFAKGDLLVLDVTGAFASASQPDLVQTKDPRLSNQHARGRDAAYEDFLSSTIYRYCRGVQEIVFENLLDYSSCVVKGSYSVLHSAKITLFTGKEKKATLKQYKRYDINELIRTLEAEGWKGSTAWAYGQNNYMCLFEKGT